MIFLSEKVAVCMVVDGLSSACMSRRLSLWRGKKGSFLPQSGIKK